MTRADKARHCGFTMAELLMSLALTAALLAAVAAAMHASMQSYSENEKIAAVTQAARSVLDRMSREIRTAVDVDCSSTKMTIYPFDDGSHPQIVYEFEAGTLYYTPAGGAVQTLLGSDEEVKVGSFDVVREDFQDDQGQLHAKIVTVCVTFSAKERSFAVTASAAPRKNQAY